MTTYELAACPVCRVRNARTIADRDDIQRELEALWQFHLRRLKTGAPIAQLFDRAIFSQQPPIQLDQCKLCGTVYRNPRERDDELIETYESEAPSREALASLFQQQLEFYRTRVTRLTALAGAPGDVLEVGSYVGGFLTAATHAGWGARGIDVNEHATAFARAQGADVEQCALHDFATRQDFTAVVLWNCFDQLADPHTALERVGTLLRPQGWLALRVPNGACYAALRGRAGGAGRLLLAWNNLASFPYRHGFTPAALSRLLRLHGFTIRRQHGDTLVPLSAEYTRGWARREERIVKKMMHLLPRRLAPWYEVYAQLTSR